MAERELTDEEIDALMAQQQPSTPTPPVEPGPPPRAPVSILQSLARGGAQGGTFGFADELAGAYDALSDMSAPESFGERYRKGRDESRAAYKAAEEDNPRAFLGGQLGGGLATAALGGLGAGALRGGAAAARAAAASAPATGTRTAAQLFQAMRASAAPAAALGGASGLGSSKADITRGDTEGAAIDTGVGLLTGGALGGVLPAAGEGIARGGRALGSYAARKAPEFALNAAGAIQHNLQKLSKPDQEQLGKWLLDEDIITARGGLGTPKDLAVKRLEDKLAGTNIGGILSEAKDPVDVAPIVERLRGQYKGLTTFEQPKALSTLQEIADSLKKTKTEGRTSFGDVNALKAAIGRDAGWGADKKAAAVNDALKAAYGNVREELADQFTKSAGPDAAARLAKDQRTWGNVQAILPTAIKGADREAGNALFGPSALAAGAATAAEGGGSIQALLNMIGAKLLKERGSSVAAGGLNSIAKRLAPEAADTAAIKALASGAAPRALGAKTLGVPLLDTWLRSRQDQ